MSAMDSTSPAPRKRLHSVSQRRQNKPLIEKRRRARINECLLQLKGLLMKDMGKESPRPSKLEKADILEMTVDYIKKIADRKPDSPGTGCATEKTAAPFLDGFSRCMEEVDTFLENQLHLQPEVRHKLLSHCREQLNVRDVTPEPDQSSRVTPLCPASPENEVKFAPLLRNAVCDSGSDVSSDDEVRVRSSCLTEDDKAAAMVAAATPEPVQTATTTAFVAPFQHTSTSPATSASLQAPAAQLSGSGTDGNGIKFAGPLKLICGGNVFIVMDQQQQQQQNAGPKGAEMLQPVVTSPPALGAQLFYSPSLYSAGAFTTYLPTALPPQVNVGGCVGVAGAPAIPLVAARVGCSPLGQKLEKDPGSLNLTLPSGARECGSSPAPAQPSPEVLPNAGSDVNNNEVNPHVHVHQASSVWRPW